MSTRRSSRYAAIRMATKVFLGFMVATSPAVFGQTGAPQTPLGILARSAGVYLGSLEYLRVFKISRCAYALPKSFPSIEEALSGEVISAFPPGEARGLIEQSMGESRQQLSQQANVFVEQTISAAQHDYDPKTACGLAAGTLVGVSQRAYERWMDDKARYGWRGR